MADIRVQDSGPWPRMQQLNCNTSGAHRPRLTGSLNGDMEVRLKGFIELCKDI